MDVAAMIENELSVELIAALEKIQDSISCWIQQEKDDAESYQEEKCSNYCASLRTVMEDEEDSIELCTFLFGSKMNDITLQLFGLNCSGRVRGFDSIIVVYPCKYTSTLTLQQRLSSNAIILLSAWERKRADANLFTPSIEEEVETASVNRFEIIDSLGGVKGKLKKLDKIISYAESLNTEYRNSIGKYDVLKDYQHCVT